jgi:hypothetical protein
MPGSRPRPARLTLAIAAASVAGLLTATATATGTSDEDRPVNSIMSNPAEGASLGLPNFDSRSGDPAARPAGDVLAAREELREEIGGGAILETEPATGAIRSLGRLDGLLTGPSGLSPKRIAPRGGSRGHLRR